MGTASPGGGVTAADTMADGLRFDDRVAIVTGAGGGLGRQHALLLASRGAAVVVNDIGGVGAVGERTLGDADAVASEITATGGRAIAVIGSIAQEDGATALVARALDAFGQVDIVVNNAGILRSCDFGDMTAAVWDEVQAVNVRGAFLVTRAAWGPMQRHGRGRVVFTTSNSGLLGVPGSTAYAASKAALWGLTRVLALEGAEHGIRVNAIAPIAFTGMSAQSRAVPAAWRDGSGDEWAARLDPRQIAPAVAWLCHDDCPLTGEVLSVAGGRVARFFLGLTTGWVSDALTPEDVRDHLDEILLEDGYEVLPRAFEEGRRLRRRLLS
jgi:NAD(P)-dependent dehydrogenase (short-subunit alcohol dehydrogenase family)